MDKYKIFWEFIKENHIGFITMEATHERLIRAVQRRNKDISSLPNFSDIEDKANYLQLLDVIGLDNSTTTNNIGNDLQNMVKQLTPINDAKQLLNKEEQEEKKELTKAVYIVLKNLDDILEIILNSENIEDAVYLLCSKYEFSDSQAHNLVALNLESQNEIIISKFAEEQKNIFDYMLRDLKFKERKPQKAHELALDTVEKIEKYLENNQDPSTMHVLSLFYYQLACDFDKFDKPEVALEYYKKTVEAKKNSFLTSQNLKSLKELSDCYYFLSIQLKRMAMIEDALEKIRLAYHIIQYIDSSNNYVDSVKDDLYEIRQVLEELDDVMR
ncbi:hypothetical protein G3O08_19070 [Cryomorpha ignava]|uniref:Tetratricopeptide repeat protein n=1 Tax=Cryomorpha ignava TaxID=101383 RepID=A0A7K3WVM7_9FLAO|nr:hypothetical protein [Cryomorpha ignava]NEN25598.1 hypothetical protein [Cryomorpha ignava]